MKFVIDRLKRFHADSLFRNSLYLITSTFVMAFFGFFFWMINTRLYTAEQIGLATTLISVTSLITGFSLFGYNTALVRFLSAEKKKSDFINTAFTIISIVAIIVTIIFIAGLSVFSPRILFIRSSPVFILSFIVLMIAASINAITESVFISFRNTKYIFFTDTIISIVKLLSTIFLVALGAYGIFYSAVIAINLATALNLIFIAYLFHIYFKPVIIKEVVQKVWKFSFGNYMAGFFSSAPGLILPLIITNSLGPKVTAYFYMPTMIIGLLQAIPRAVNQSLFAESSSSETQLKHQIIKSLKIIGVILIPAVVVLLFLGKYALLAFGKEYSIEGFAYLQLISLSIIVGIPNSIFGIVYNIRRQVRKIVYINIIGFVVAISLSLLFLSKGLPGIGIASILTQIVLISVNFIFYKWELPLHSKNNQ